MYNTIQQILLIYTDQIGRGNVHMPSIQRVTAANGGYDNMSSCINVMSDAH